MALSVAFYKARYGKFLDKLVNATTGGGGYSHVEIVFSDGTSFSSSFRDGGSRFARIDFGSGKWDLITTNLTEEEELKVFEFCKAQNGKPYDLFGAVGLVVPVLTQDKKKWFCSEIVIAAMQQVNIMSRLKPYEFSPNKLQPLCTRPGIWVRYD